jgi:hypothetical protein
VVSVRSEVDFSRHQFEGICKSQRFVVAKFAYLDPTLGRAELHQEEIERYRLESQNSSKEAGRLAAYLYLRRAAKMNFKALKYGIKANMAQRNFGFVTSKGGKL